MPRKKKVKKAAQSAHRAKPKRAAAKARRATARKPAKSAMKRKKDLTMDDIDQKIRINELKFKLDDIAGRETPMFISEDCPPDIQEAFLNSVVAYESSPAESTFKKLRKDGVALPPPDQLKDAELPAKVLELIQRLAKRGTFLFHTNHLSDRELYEKLWSDTLREEMPDMPGGATGYFGLDMIGSGSDEDIFIDMKYYASEKERKRWKKEYPDFEMPPHEEPPYDRDKDLPTPPF